MLAIWYDFCCFWSNTGPEFILQHRARWFSDVNPSQGSVTKRLKCDEILSDCCVANLLLSVSVKERWKSVKWIIYDKKLMVYFWSPGMLMRNLLSTGIGSCHCCYPIISGDRQTISLGTLFASLIHVIIKSSSTYYNHIQSFRLKKMSHNLATRHSSRANTSYAYVGRLSRYHALLLAKFKTRWKQRRSSSPKTSQTLIAGLVIGLVLSKWNWRNLSKVGPGYK